MVTLGRVVRSFRDGLLYLRQKTERADTANLWISINAFSVFRFQHDWPVTNRAPLLH